MAQGPLEAGPSLFSATLRAARRLRAARPVEMPPYHVLQATVAASTRCFERVGLKTLEYVVSEVAWPAPTSALSWTVARQPRSLGLLVPAQGCRRRPRRSVAGRLGNRYFYVGRAGHELEREPDDHWQGVWLVEQSVQMS